MKVPNNQINLELLKTKPSNSIETVVTKMDKPESLNFFIHSPNLDDAKGTVKYIKDTVRLIRASDEYTRYIGILKNLEVNKCSYFSNISLDDASLKGVKIEMHHYPFTIYDITELVYRDYVEREIPITQFDIADTVMQLHFEGLVGLVPLSLTAHELNHNGTLVIPLDVPLGNIKAFIMRYKHVLTNDLKDVLRHLIQVSETTSDDYINLPLERKISLLDIEGFKPNKSIKIKSKEEQTIS